MPLTTLRAIFLLTDLLHPSGLSKTDCKMHQHTAVVGAVPMNCLGRALHDIARADALRLPSLVAHPPTSGLDLEYLSIFVVVPVGPSTGKEGDMIAHYAVYGARELVHPERRRSVLVLYVAQELLFEGGWPDSSVEES